MLVGKNVFQLSCFLVVFFEMISIEGGLGEEVNQLQDTMRGELCQYRCSQSEYVYN